MTVGGVLASTGTAAYAPQTSGSARSDPRLSLPGIRTSDSGPICLGRIAKTPLREHLNLRNLGRKTRFPIESDVCFRLNIPLRVG